MPAPAKAKKTRTVDYTRTDKRPHSFRYKRGHEFVPRAEKVNLAKEADGTLVIGPAPEGSQQDADVFAAGTVRLVNVKKRANGKTAIAFARDDGSEIVCYDARAARAALRSS